MDNNFYLPPPPAPGQKHTPADEAAVIAYVDGLMEEAYEARAPLEDQADRNNNLHLGRCRLEKMPHGVTAVDLNRIRNVDIAHVQVQTESTPRIKLQARENAEPGVAFFDTRVDVGNIELDGPLKDFFASIAPAFWQPGAGGVDGSVVPLTDAVRGQVEAAIEAGLVPPEAMIIVNDRAKADAKQTVFDAMWEECRADYYIREAAFRKTIIGWQFPLYGFDDTTRKHTLFNPSHLQVFVDPLCTDIADAAHAELLQWLDLYRAQALYPGYDFSDAVIPPGGYLESNASRGGFNYRIPEVYKRTQFRRPMVAARHAWIRDYPFPLSAEEALAAGHIVPAPAAIPPANQEGMDAAPAGVGGVGAAGAGGVDDAGAVPPAYLDASTGLPANPAQYTRPGIREICIVGTSVVADGPTQFGNIPLVHFVDLPILDSPYGQGQPEALEPMQLALNAILTDVITHFHYCGMAAIAMPVEVAQRLPGFKSGVYAAPHSEIWEIPADLLQKYGDISKLIGFIEPPPMPADFWRFFDLLMSLIDKEGQVAEVMEGEGKSNWSGDTVSRLQEAARGLIGWKSQRMEHGLEYLAALMLHTIDTRLTVQELARFCSKYPPYVWQYIQSQPSDLDITVEIVSGSGQLREQAKQEAFQLWNQGTGPLSATTLLERFGEDPKQELHNKITEAEESAKAAQAAAPMAPPMAGGPGPMGSGPGGAAGGGGGGLNQGAPPAVGGAPVPGQPVAAAA